MRFTPFFLLVFAILLISVGCGDDDVAGPNPLPIPRDEIPVPERYDQHWSPPDRSDSVVLDEVEVSTFEPLIRLRQCPDSDPPVDLEIEITDRRATLVEDGVAVHPRVEVRSRSFDLSGGEWVTASTGLAPGCFRHLSTLGQTEYYLSREAMALDVARWNARIVGGRLAAIDDEVEQEALVQAMSTEGIVSTVWIGLYDTRDPLVGYQWLDGSDSDYRNWDSGEPNHADEQVTEMRPYGKWNDTGPFDANPALVEILGPCADEDVDEMAVYVLRVKLIWGGELAVGNLYLRKTNRLPRLQRRQYWSFVVGAWVSPGELHEFTERYTTGVEETTTTELARTSGVTKVGYKDIMVEFGDQLTETFGHSITLTEQTEVTKSRSYTGREGANTWYAVWQLREEYVFVDENGDPWTDPQFELRSDPKMDRGLQVTESTIVEF